MSAIYKRLKKSNIEDLLAEASLIAKVQFKFYLAVIMIDQQGYTRFYEAMLRIIISHGRKNYIWSHSLTLMICLNQLGKQD